MTALLVDIVIATGFVAACFLTALVLYGITFDVSRWWHARHEEPAVEPVEQWGDLIHEGADWTAWDDRRAA